MDRSTVSRWPNHFRGGCVRIDNDPRPGRPRRSTDERSVNLPADALKEDRCATCEELSRATGANSLQENAQEAISGASGWPLILLDNARPHFAHVVTNNFAIMGGKCYLMRPTVQI